MDTPCAWCVSLTNIFNSASSAGSGRVGLAVQRERRVLVVVRIVGVCLGHGLQRLRKRLPGVGGRAEVRYDDLLSMYDERVAVWANGSSIRSAPMVSPL